MKYCVKYVETYSRYYDVEADSIEEAENKVRDGICNGELPGPDECIFADCEEAEEISA